MGKVYKSGEAPQVGDSVMGEVDGAPLRGKVVALKDEETAVVASRAPYHHDPRVRSTQPNGGAPRFGQAALKLDGLTLVYRHAPPAAAEAPRAKASKRKG